MTQIVFAGERLSFRGRPVGLAQEAPSAPASMSLTYAAGETWELNFYADQPVSPDQFFALAAEFQTEPVEIISFMPVTDRHFRAIVKWREGGAIPSTSEAEWAGVRYTVNAKPYSTEKLPSGGGEVPAQPSCPPGGQWDPETQQCVPFGITPEPTEPKTSKGAIIGVGAAVVAAGTVVYFVSRKKKSRRRRAASPWRSIRATGSGAR